MSLANIYNWLATKLRLRWTRLPNDAHSIEAANLCIAVQLQIDVWEKEARVKR